MSKHWKLRIAASFLLILVLFCYNAHGYIDPGTTSALFGILAPLISILLVVLGFLIWPFRRLFRSVISRFSGSQEPEADVQSEPDGEGHQHGDGQSA